MTSSHGSRTIGIGGSSYITTTDDAAVVLKGYEIWKDGERVLHRETIVDDDGERMIQREAAIYKHLGDHPRILKCFGLEEVGPGIHSLRLERAPFKDVRRYIRHHRKPPPAAIFRLRMALEAARGVTFLHLKGVRHCDLSCRNLLLFQDYHVKLADFGSSLANGFDFKETHCEETAYALPLRGRSFHGRPGHLRDIFALGSLMYEITEWKTPWEGSDNDEIRTNFDLNDFPPFTQEHIFAPVIRGCWMEGYNASSDVLMDLVELLGKVGCPS